MLFSILGSFILVSSLNFLRYLELGFFTTYWCLFLIFPRKKSTAPEGAMKYFVMSAMASGMFLFGVSLLYLLARKALIYCLIILSLLTQSQV